MLIDTQKSWSKAEFNLLNSLYRKGNSNKEILLSSAKELFQLALKAINNRNRPELDVLPDVLNSMVVSFEIMENYFDIPDDVAKYFKGEVDRFCVNVGEVSIAYFKKRIQDIFGGKGGESKVAQLEYATKTKEFCLIATHYILVNICGINIYYRENSDKKALEKLKILFEYIRLLNVEKGKPNDLNSSLYALASYFKGKVLFSQAEYQEGLTSFQDCSNCYLNKLLLTVEDTPEAFLTRTVATRRYALSLILGQAFILQSQGRLNQAKELCEVGLPLLINTNLVLKTYAEFIYRIILRGLNSSDENVLLEHLKDFERIKAIFISELSNPKNPDSSGTDFHYVQRCELEICLVKLFLAKITDDFHKKLELFSDVQNSVEAVIHSNVCKDIKPNGKNSRLKASAYTILSYCLREFPITDKDGVLEPAAKTGKNSVPRLKSENKQEENCLTALKYAELAIEYSESSKKLSNENKIIQAYCDALIERGLVYKKLYELYLQIYQRNIRTFSLNGEQAKGLLTEARKNKSEAVKNLFDGLQANLNQKNERIEASIWLQLTSIELLDLNLHFCEYNYQKYLNLHVEHDYLKEFAKKIKVEIERLRLYALPFLMGENENSYSRNEWVERIENYLLEKIVFQTVLDLDGKLPAKEFNDQNYKGNEKNRIYEDFGWGGNTSRRTLLTDALINKLGLSKNEASKWAKKCTGYLEYEDNLLEKSRKKHKEFKEIDSKIIDQFFGLSDLQKSTKIVFAYGRLDDEHMSLMQRNLRNHVDTLGAEAEGITAWIPSDDIESTNELIKLLTLAGKDVKYLDDNLENIDKNENSIISYGLFNRFAMYMSEFCQNNLFQIKFQKSPITGKLTDNFEIKGICPIPDNYLPKEDYAIIARIVSKQKADKTKDQVQLTSIIVAGRHANGTTISSRFLNRNIPLLLSFYGKCGKELNKDSMVIVIKHPIKKTDGNLPDGSIATNKDLQKFSKKELGKADDFFIHWEIDNSVLLDE